MNKELTVPLIIGAVCVGLTISVIAGVSYMINRANAKAEYSFSLHGPATLNASIEDRLNGYAKKLWVSDAKLPFNTGSTYTIIGTGAGTTSVEITSSNPADDLTNLGSFLQTIQMSPTSISSSKVVLDLSP